MGMSTRSVMVNMDSLGMEMSTPGIGDFVNIIAIILYKFELKLQFLFLRGSPTLVQALPGPSVQVSAGSNHTAVLLMDGQVFTFGSFSVR